MANLSAIRLLGALAVVVCTLGACVPQADDDDDDDRRRRRDSGVGVGDDGGAGDDDGGSQADDGGVDDPDGGDIEPDGGNVDPDGGYVEPDGGSAADAGTVPDAGTVDAGPGDPLPGGSSVEVGRTLYGTDFALYDGVPTGGLLFSVWSRIADPPPSSIPWVRGNMDVFVLRGVGWHMRCLGGNIHVYSSDFYTYNANSMLFAGSSGEWVEDYSFYLADPGIPEAEVHDWVWLAWQVIVESDAFVIRQWVKFGPDRAVLPMIESRVTFAQVRSILVNQRGWSSAAANAWQPGQATSFQVGSDHGYLFHARMDATSTVPTNAQLEAIAGAADASTAAWADYAITWHDGAADIADRSGHGRHLEIASGGQLHQGVAPPY